MRVYWYCPLKIFEAFEDMSDNPSFRLRCLNTHEHLKKHGYFSKIVHNISEIKDPNIVVLLSFGEEELSLARWVKSIGAKLIHDYSENIRGIPILEETKQLCDQIVCCSTILGNLESQNYPDKVSIVKDPIEETPIVHNSSCHNDKLKVAWMGMSGNAYLGSELIKPIVQYLDMDYVEISNSFNSDIVWNRKTWQTDLASCDIAICPQDHWKFPAKSNVKVTTAMSLGLPTIASPIRSYTEVITQGVNGFICENLEQWEYSLQALKSKDLRKLFVKRSKDSLIYYSADFIYRQWEAVFKKCIRGK